MKNNYYLATGVAYLLFWINVAIQSIGNAPEICEEYTWQLPIIITVLIAPPLWLGFMAGKNES